MLSYRRVINAVQREIKLAKQVYFKNGIEQNNRDSGKLWSHLNSLGFSKTSPSRSNIVLEQDNKKFFDSFTVARIFNKFYTDVASSLVAKLPTPYGIYATTGELFRRFYSEKLGLRPSFVLTPVTSHFIRSQLSGLNPKKAVGLDDISSLFLRYASGSIVSPITHLINLSILTEQVWQAKKDASPFICFIVVVVVVMVIMVVVVIVWMHKNHK